MNCEALRAKRLAADTMGLVDYVWRISPGARPLMLTLTSRNQPLDQTRAMVLDHQKALKAFFAYDRIVNATLGQFGNIEIDFENRDGAFFAHVHSHHIVIVEPRALSDHRYIRQTEWVALWRRARRLDYKPVCDIRAIKSHDGQSTNPDSVRWAVREVCKYCLDSGSFIQHENGLPLVEPAVAVAFAVAVHRRRLTSMTGIFAAAKKLRARECKTVAAVECDDTPSDFSDAPPF
jgi:Replication protein